MKTVCRYESPVGTLFLAAAEDGVTDISVRPVEGGKGMSPVLRRLISLLDAYFAGQNPDFSQLPLAPAGTEFRRRVWAALRAIPYGATSSYGQIAGEIGCRGGARAVGGACGANPLLIVVPCHRVLGSDGRLTGFSAGMERKKWLLAHESRTKLAY